MLKKFCLHRGCRALVTDGYCDKHKKDKQAYDQYRGSSTERGYDARWRRYRISFLKEHPLCTECMKEGRITPATVVDHITPHKGDYDLFWDPDNHQSLCKPCHDYKTATEDGGFGNGSIYKPGWLKPSSIPLILVCGAPGSGKTKYVNDNKEPNDIVIDLDEIKSKISSDPWYRSENCWIEPAIKERNKMLSILSQTNRNDIKAWFIVSAPSARDRVFWKEKLKPIKTIVMLTKPEICKQRIRMDSRRSDIANRFYPAIDKWWSCFTKGQGEDYVV